MNVKFFAVVKTEDTQAAISVIEGDHGEVVQTAHLNDKLAQITFWADLDCELGIRYEVFYPDDCELYSAACDACDEYSDDIRNTGVDGVIVSYDNEVIEDIMDDLAKEYPQDDDEDPNADDWVHERLCGNI